ncbi:unnamed protein product, partial [Amoebophrya sp. A120]
FGPGPLFVLRRPPPPPGLVIRTGRRLDCEHSGQAARTRAWPPAHFLSRRGAGASRWVERIMVPSLGFAVAARRRAVALFIPVVSVACVARRISALWPPVSLRKFYTFVAEVARMLVH